MKTMMATCMIFKLLFWSFLITVFMTDLNYGQSHLVTDTFSRQKETVLLKEILQLVKNQAEKMQTLERELTSMNDKLSKCLSISRSFPSGRHDEEQQDTTTSLISREKSTTLETNPTMQLTSASDIPIVKTEGETATRQDSLSTTDTATSAGNKGKEFIILFMRNINDAENPVTVYITTEHNTSVNISTSAHLNSSIKAATDRIMNVSSFSKIMLSRYLTCDYLRIEPKAVLIQTSELSTVSIFDSSYKTYSNDGAMVIPTNRLSMKYLVSSTNPDRTRSYLSSQFAVAALYEVTSVNIRFNIKKNTSLSLLGRTYRDNDLLTIILNKYETLQVMHTTDLTGTFIVSTKPISVFSGNRCQFLKNGCSHMMTQLPPTTEFDNRYIVPPFYGEWGTLIQVISERQSSINISVGSTVSMWHMQEKEFKNTEVTTDETTIIESTNPVLVTGFGMGSSNNDPYMTVMPGVHQYIDNYKIVIPDGYRDNYICVIIPEKSKNYLQINGIPIESNITVRLSSAVLDTIYSIYTFKVNSGAKVLSTTNNAAFGLIAYSHRHSDGYAFAGNYVLP